MFQLKNIKEVVYSVGNLEKVKHFFCDYGGWEVVGNYKSAQQMLDFWNLPAAVSGDEILIQFDNHPTGLLRLVKYNGVQQDYIRSSQKSYETGGIMDINLRVHNVQKTFNELREMGWHGLSDPLFQTMGPFQLYDVLMQGYDDIIVAITHRKVPKLELKDGFKLPTHIYNSSIVVKDLLKARQFYENVLGFKLLNEYEVTKEGENMFGIPFNVIPKVKCKANIFSVDGTRDVVFQIIQFDGVVGKDFSAKAIPPNRGFLTYRVEVESGIENFHQQLTAKNTKIIQPLKEVYIDPYGPCKAFAVIDPDGVWWTFYNKS